MKSSFDGYFVLKTLYKKTSKKYEHLDNKGKICIPIKLTSHWRALGLHKGKALCSYLITDEFIHFRYKVDSIIKKTIGETEGADQGAKTVVTLSDGQVTKVDIHGHSLDSIMKDLARKKKGSKAFERKQRHRKNYINWSIKQLDLKNIKQINLEKLRYLGRRQKKSRYLQGFAYKDIRTAMEKLSFFNGVTLKEQSNAYRSQRCSHCGFVHKSNRRGKTFTCIKCEFTCDADLNAALNHKHYLPEVVRSGNLPNKSSGFYWTKDGLFDVDWLELTVPIANKSKSHKR